MEESQGLSLTIPKERFHDVRYESVGGGSFPRVLLLCLTVFFPRVRGISIGVSTQGNTSIKGEG